MKKISLKDARKFKNSDSCIYLEYPLNDPDINTDIVKLNGRYPNAGFAINTKCKEVTYVIKGSGLFGTENKIIRLKQGDVIFIQKNEKYYWEGKLVLCVSCAPAWTPEQHKIVIE